MSKNLKLKRVALVAISAMGFGVFSVMPAKAASLSSVTLGDLTSATVAARSSTQVTFLVTTDAAASGDAIVYSLAVTTKPAASSLAVDNPATTAAASAKVAFRTGSEATVTGWALTTVGATRKDTSSGTTAISAGNRGIISITPDAAGVYVITLSATATPNAGAALAAVTKTFTVTATAVNNSSLLADTLNLKQFTASPKTDSQTKVNLGLKMTAGVTPTLGDGMSLTAYLSSYPSGGFQQVTASTSCSDGATGATYPTALDAYASATGPTLTLGATAVATDATAITASTTACSGSLSFTPTKAGDFTLTVWADSDGDGAIDIGEAVQTLVITVVDKAGYSNSLSTAYIIAGNGTTRAVAGTDAEGYVFASKTMSTANSAAIAVAVVDSTGTAMTSGNTLTATITGVGGVVASAGNQSASQCNASTVTRISSVTSDGQDVVYVCADGNAGVGTVTIQVTNAAGATTTLATKTVSFYGAVTGISTTSSLRTIGRAGGYTLGAADGSLAARDGTEGTTPAFIVKTVDAAGGVANIAAAGVPEIISSDLTVVTGGTCVLDGGASIYSSGLGSGFYNCNFDTALTSVSGQKATLTVRTANPAVANAYLTTTVDVTIGGSASTHTLTFDKSAYAPGEAMVMTWKAVDSAGNPVYDGLATPEISFNKAIGGSSQTVAASVYVGGTYATSSTRPAIFAPSSGGVFLARASAAVAGVTSQLLVEATVADDATTAAANAASDAASEAIDAANAATDAANLAAEAADAATVAAEEARDAADAATAAVEALATEFATLTAGIKAQITTLANVVAKIAKRTKS